MRPCSTFRPAFVTEFAAWKGQSGRITPSGVLSRGCDMELQPLEELVSGA